MAIVEGGYVTADYVATGYVGWYPWSFGRGSTLLQFARAPQRPPRSRGFVQADVVTGGGERLGRDYYRKNDLITLTWRNMPAADKAALLSFWTTTARGAGRSFYYTDGAGRFVLARFATPTLPGLREVAYDAWSVTMTLRVL